MKDRRVLFSFARYLLPYWKQEVLVLGLLIAGTLTSLTPPYLMKVIIDDVFPYKEYDLLMLVLAGLLAAALVGALSMFGVDYLYSRGLWSHRSACAAPSSRPDRPRVPDSSGLPGVPTVVQRRQSLVRKVGLRV